LKTHLYLSVAVPVYNEEDSVHLLYEKIRVVCQSINKPYEIIFVDDGSSDRTPEILQEIQDTDPHFRRVQFRRNYGQTAAMAAGFDAAQGERVVSMDGDLQNDPSDIPMLLNKMDEGYDVVCGWRKNRQDKFWSRRFPSIIANWIIGRVTGVRIHDNGCSLKAYRASIIKNVFLYGEMHRFIPAMTTLTGARVTEVVVKHHARQFGESKYGISRVWRVILDIITVKMIIGFASKPLRWFGFFSLPFVIAGFVSFFATKNFLAVEKIESWLVMTTVGLLFFFLGTHLIALGIIGELSMKTGDFRPSKGLRPNIKTLRSNTGKVIT